MKICYLIHNQLLVSQDDGSIAFKKFSERRMWEIFQLFIKRFYHRESNHDVDSPQVKWDANPIGEDDLRYLPVMQTDMVLESRNQRIVIDTKYTEKILSSGDRYKGKLQSEHLYQITAYLRNLETLGGLYRTCSGILLYPFSGESVDRSYQMGNHMVSIKTIDLTQQWQDIHGDLLALVSE